MTAAAVYVAYGVDHLDLDWIPDDVVVVVVHNDDRLDPAGCGHPGLRHVDAGGNVGFGAGVNLALEHVVADRVVLCNPDTELTRDHWRALTAVHDDEVVTVALVDDEGRPNSVVNRYWNLAAFLASALRLGRLVPRGRWSRRLVGRLLGDWGSAHTDSMAPVPDRWPLRDRWASGAVLSLPLEPVRRVGGFDEGFFLYYEDADLQQRMAASFPELSLRLAETEPARHTVGASADDGTARRVARARRRSAARYASRQTGVSWRLAATGIGWTAR